MRSRSRSTCASWTRPACGGANVFALNEPDREPAYRAPNDRVLELGRRGAGSAVPVRAAEPRRGSARRGRALSRAGSARHQAASARAGVPRQRPAARGRLRAGRRAPSAGADPRRSRAAAGDAARARPRRRAAPERLADPGARGDRGAGRHRRAGAQRREHLLRQLDLVAARPAQPALARSAGAGPVGLRHPVRRAARRAQPVRARARAERRGRCAPARDAGRHRARPARRDAARARARRRSRAARVPHLVRARAGQLVHGLRHDRCSGWACPSASDSWASPRRRCAEEGLDEQAELVRCTAALWAAVGRDASCPARRPTWSVAAASSGCSTPRRPTRCSR